MNLLQQFFDKHSLTLLTSFFIVVFTYLVCLFIQKILVSNGRRRAELTVTLWDDVAVDIIQNIQKYFILAASVYIGLFWIDLPERWRLITDKAFILICLIQTAKLAGILINFWLNRKLKKKADQDFEMASTLGLISIGVKFIVYSMILLVALNNLGVDITALVAGLGVGGVAVALALQNILADLFSSLTIVLDKPFIVGDFIIVNDLMGTVEHIGLKTTRIRSLSGEQLIFGNGDLLQSRIKNYKRMNERRVVQTFVVNNKTSWEKLDLIPKIVQDIVTSKSNTIFDRCHFLRLLESSPEFEVVYKVKSPDFNVYADTAHAINVELLRKLAQENIELAYPSRALFVQNRE